MKATIESTSSIVDLDTGGLLQARVWEGVTDAGIKFAAYIALVQVRTDADNSEFVRDLREHKKPSAETQRAIDMRMVI